MTTRFQILRQYIIPSAFLLILCGIINKLLALLIHNTPQEAYYTFSPIFTSTPFLALFVLTLGYVIFKRTKSQRYPINNYSNDIAYRLITFIPLIYLTWFYLTQEYNFYLERWFLTDRLLLVILALVVIFESLFLGPFICALFLLNHSFDFPLGIHPILDKRLAIQFLVAVYSVSLFTSLRSHLFKKFRNQTDLRFLFQWLIFYVFIAYYFYTGVEKLRISPDFTEWLIENEQVNNITAMMNRGWLEDSGAGLREWIKKMSIDIRYPIAVFVLLVELGSLFLLTGRKYSLIIIPSLIVMHLLIFAGNGGLFVGWIIPGIILFELIRRRKLSPAIFTPGAFLMMLLLIPFAPLTVKPIMLGWFDSRVDNYFEIRVANNTGRYKIHPSQLQPFHHQMLAGTFLYASSQKAPSPGFINSNYEEVSYFRNVIDPKEILDYLETKSPDRYDSQRASEIRDFLKQLAKHRNRINNSPSLIRFFQPPLYWNAARQISKDQAILTSGDTLMLVHIINYMRDGETIRLKEQVEMSEIIK